MTAILVVKPIKNEQTMGGGCQVIEEQQVYCKSATKAMNTTIQKRQ